MENRTEQELVRIQKMNELKDKGIDPFGHAFSRTHRSAELKALYGDKTKEELEELIQIVPSIPGLNTTALLPILQKIHYQILLEE